MRACLKNKIKQINKAKVLYSLILECNILREGALSSVLLVFYVISSNFSLLLKFFAVVVFQSLEFSLKNTRQSATWAKKAAEPETDNCPTIEIFLSWSSSASCGGSSRLEGQGCSQLWYPLCRILKTAKTEVKALSTSDRRPWE